MPTSRGPKALSKGEYVKSGHTVDDQITGARRELIQAIQRVSPEFFESLRKRVYPKFARYARVAARTPPITPKGLRRGPGYWETGWRFETWEVEGGPSRFKSHLLSWAREFGSADETWILEGALETLSAWYKHPDWLESLDVRRFQLPAAGNVLVDFEELSFHDSGWSPQWEKWATYRARVQARFTEQLRAYEVEVRKLVESRGGQPARRRYSIKNFEWFALYQIRGMSSVKILDFAGVNGDESTVLKGIKTAGQLLGWTSLRPSRSRKSRQ